MNILNVADGNVVAVEVIVAVVLLLVIQIVVFYFL